jgi:hypothetical protein
MTGTNPGCSNLERSAQRGGPAPGAGAAGAAPAAHALVARHLQTVVFSDPRERS